KLPRAGRSVGIDESHERLVSGRQPDAHRTALADGVGYVDEGEVPKLALKISNGIRRTVVAAVRDHDHVCVAAEHVAVIAQGGNDPRLFVIGGNDDAQTDRFGGVHAIGACGLSGGLMRLRSNFARIVLRASSNSSIPSKRATATNTAAPIAI